AIRNERQRPPIGGPFRRFAGAASIERLLGLFRSIDRSKPDPAIAHECDPIAFGRDDRSIAVSEQFRRSARNRYRPYLDPRLDRQLRGIGRRLTLAIRAVVAAAYIHD